MSKQIWTKKELEYLAECISEGIHPEVLTEKIKKKFKINRSESAIRRKLEFMKISYAHCKTKKELEREKNRLEAHKISIPTLVEEQSFKQDLQLYKSQYQKAIKELAIQDKIVKIMQDVIPTLPNAPKYNVEFKKDKTHTTEDCVLVLSDIHAGEIISAADTNFLNEYNFDIACDRLKLLVNKIQNLILHKLIGYNFRKLYILGLGDFISGHIHEELVEGAEGNVVEWTINLSFVLAQMIQDLLQVYPEIEFVGVVGNHGRLYKKPRFKSRYVNWDFLTYQFLSMFCYNDIKSGRVKFDIPTSFWTLKEINGWNWLIMHGDNIQGWNGVPWYGITRAIHRLKELVATKNLKFNYAVMGHFHNRGLLDTMDGQLIVNGSVIGGNEYSIGKMFTTGRPNQHFCGVHIKEGISWEFKLNLDNAPTQNDYTRAPFTATSLGNLILDKGK